MFGQPLVNELVNILVAHKDAVSDENRQNRKALVISLHGWSGVGKNYASTMIAEALYKKGMNSKYVKLFMGNKDFDCTDLNKSTVQQLKVSTNYKSIELFISRKFYVRNVHTCYGCLFLILLFTGKNIRGGECSCEKVSKITYNFG